MSISEFLELNYRHFNARETLEAARAFKSHVQAGGRMLLALAGAMSTAELGITLARMIREDKIHAISCSAAWAAICRATFRMTPYRPPDLPVRAKSKN